MSNPADQALVDALQQIVAASGPNGDNSFAAREIGGKLAKQKDLKAALEPLAKQIKNGSGIWIVQSCLELPADHPLHAAALALVASGGVPWPVYLPVGDDGPKRTVRNLILSKHAPVVYAFEDEPRVSLWSMETGAHLRDVKIPAKKGQAVLWHFTDLADGTLRAMTPRGAVLQCKPGGSEFTSVLELGQGSFATNGDLSRIVGTTEKEIVTKDDGEWVTLAVHSVADKKKSEFEVPLSSVGSDLLTVNGRYALITGTRFISDGAGGGEENHTVAVYDFETGETKLRPIGGSAYATQGPREGTALLTWSEASESGASVNKAAILDVVAGVVTPTEREEGHETGYRFTRGHIRKDGEVIGGYVVDPDSNRTPAAFDPKTGRIAVASEVPAASVRVLERFDPSRPATTPRAEKPAAAPLAWARTGALLRYSIADFDAEDEWTFELVDATDGLKLHVVCDGAGDFDIAFTANALAGASAFASFSQGSTSEDTGKPVDKKLPPFLLSHATFAKIAGGKKLAWKSEWTDKDSLESQGRGTAKIDVNGAEQVVAVFSAAGEEASIEVLDDASWPLLVTRTEGDCHVKLLSVDLSKAKGDVAKPVATEKPAKAAKPAASEAAPASAGADAGGWQRYESTEDGASKFWEVSLAGSTMNIRFGKIGTSGQAQTKSFASDDAARAERDKLVREKTKKGYRANE